MKINHVMSSNTQSGIYDSLVAYFEKYATDCEIYKSEKPLEGMDIYHYYRPHLEKKLMDNSVVTVHHDLHDTDSWLSIDKFIERYKEAKSIICLNSNQEKILNNLGIENTIVIPHGYNENIFNINQKRIYNKSDKLKIGLISKRYGRKVKGEAYFYEIIKYLDNTKFEFILVGDGRIDDAYKLQQWGFSVEVYEYLPYRSFNSLYKSIDVLLMISLFEGGPANIPEAIVTKTPVFGFDIGMVSDYVKDNKNGIILTGDVKQDAKIMNSFAVDRNKFKKMIDECNKHHPNLYSWQEVINKNVDVYKEISLNNILKIEESI